MRNRGQKVEAGWYFLGNGILERSEVGPLDKKTILRLAHEGQLTNSDLVRHATATSGQWVELATIPELASKLSKALPVHQQNAKVPSADHKPVQVSGLEPTSVRASVINTALGSSTDTRILLCCTALVGLTLITLAIAIWLDSSNRQARLAKESDDATAAAFRLGINAFKSGMGTAAAPLENRSDWLAGWKKANDDAERSHALAASEAARIAQEKRNREEAAARLAYATEQRQHRLALWRKCESQLDESYRKSSRWEYQLREMRDALNMAANDPNPDVRDFAHKFLQSQRALITLEEAAYLRGILASTGLSWQALKIEAEQSKWW